MLAHTRSRKPIVRTGYGSCNVCQYYARRFGDDEVVVSGVLHHRNCKVVRPDLHQTIKPGSVVVGKPHRVATAGAVEDNKDAPFVVLGAIGIGLLIAAKAS